MTWPQSGVTLFLTCQASLSQGRAAFAVKWPLQSSKPVAAIHDQSNPEQVLSRDLAPIRGYFVPYLSSKSKSRQNCFCSEVALAELQTSSSQAPIRGYFVPYLNCFCSEVALAELQTSSSHPRQVLSRDLAPIRGYFVPYLPSKSESRQNCFCSEVALAELQTSSSHPRPQSGVTLFLTCQASLSQGRTAFAVKWPLQSSKPVAAIHDQSNPEQVLSRDLAPIRGYFVPYLSSKSESRQNCFCSEVALAELQTSSSHPRPK